jgi:hypothetical protein
MILFSLFSAFLIHCVFIAGLVIFLIATFMGMIPIIALYQKPAQIVGVILLSFGIYLEGGLSYKNKIAVQVANLEKRLAEAEVKAAQTNTRIVTKLVKDTNTIRVKGDTIIRYVDREVVKIDRKCEVPPEVITAYNEAASGNMIEATTNEITKPDWTLPVRTTP